MGRKVSFVNTYNQFNAIRYPGVWGSVKISGLNSSVVRVLALYTTGPGLESRLRLFFSQPVTEVGEIILLNLKKWQCLHCTLVNHSILRKSLLFLLSLLTQKSNCSTNSMQVLFRHKIDGMSWIIDALAGFVFSSYKEYCRWIYRITREQGETLTWSNVLITVQSHDKPPFLIIIEFKWSMLCCPMILKAYTRYIDSDDEFWIIW